MGDVLEGYIDKIIFGWVDDTVVCEEKQYPFRAAVGDLGSPAGAWAF